MSTSTRETWAAVALTLLRVGAGVILMAHGLQKLLDPAGTAQGFAGIGIPIAGVAVWLAIAGELLGGLGLALGLLTPLSALGPLLVMASAIVFVHAGNGLYAANGGWEYPLVLLLVSLYFALRGAGPISVDAAIGRLRRRRRAHRFAPVPA
jgi:putative oxidoreductase